MKHAFALVALACLGCALTSPMALAQSSEVRIYRCTDAAGHLSLRDSPCPAGQHEQVREMQRPKDAPSAVRPPPPQPSVAPQPAPVAQVYFAPPQPMYECTTSDGKRYTSDKGDGNPRWVPLWTLGDPYFGRPSHLDGGRGSFRRAPSVNASVGRPQQTLPATLPSQLPSPRPNRGDWATANGGGTWIHDVCTMLPHAETCARLRDRRDEIRGRFFRAMPSERDVLRVEERGINARLGNDCGGH